MPRRASCIAVLYAALVVTAEDHSSDAVLAAKLLFDQSEFHLRNELELAQALRDARKTISVLLALVVVIGLFRMDLHRQPGEITVVPGWSLCLIRLLFSGSVIALLFGIVYLFTERPILAKAPVGERQGALSDLNIPDEVLEALYLLPAERICQIRTQTFRLAYDRLRAANNRVRGRLVSATLWLSGSALLAFLGFSLYFWTIDTTIHGA